MKGEVSVKKEGKVLGQRQVCVCSVCAVCVCKMQRVGKGAKCVKSVAGQYSPRRRHLEWITNVSQAARR